MTTPLIDDHLASPSDADPAQAAFHEIKERARRELPDAAFNLWFGNLVCSGLGPSGLELVAPTAYVRNWLVKHHLSLVTGAARSVLGPDATVQIRAAKPAADASGTPRRSRPGPDP